MRDATLVLRTLDWDADLRIDFHGCVFGSAQKKHPAGVESQAGGGGTKSSGLFLDFWTSLASLQDRSCKGGS